MQILVGVVESKRVLRNHEGRRIFVRRFNRSIVDLYGHGAPVARYNFVVVLKGLDAFVTRRRQNARPGNKAGRDGCR